MSMSGKTMCVCSGGTARCYSPVAAVMTVLTLKVRMSSVSVAALRSPSRTAPVPVSGSAGRIT